jgi:hypothetical protein
LFVGAFEAASKSLKTAPKPQSPYSNVEIRQMFCLLVKHRKDIQSHVLRIWQKQAEIGGVLPGLIRMSELRRKFELKAGQV